MKDALNQIETLSHIKHLLTLTRFNNYLLIPIHVLEHIHTNAYQIQIGNKTIQTMSHIDLEVGVRYWGELVNAENSLQFSNLKKQPSMLQMNDFALSFEYKSLEHLFALQNLSVYMKNTVLQAMSEAKNKYEFNFLINLLTSMENQTITIPYTYASKNNFMQFQCKDEQMHFYITTNNLGAISGVIVKHNNAFAIEVNTFFKNGFSSLMSDLENLFKPYFIHRKINLVDDIEPLYNYRSSQSVSV